MFVHQAMGSFDLRNADGQLRFANPAALPFGAFVIAAQEPAAVTREYAKITGYP
jgi:hypothetical protein